MSLSSLWCKRRFEGLQEKYQEDEMKVEGNNPSTLLGYLSGCIWLIDKV